MSDLKSRSSLGAELRAATEETGIAVVTDGDRTFIVVELEAEPIVTPKEPYRVIETDEAAALMDALNDQNNPTYTTAEAIAYLQERRSQRTSRG